MTGRPIAFDGPGAGAGRRMRLHAFAVLALTLVAGLALGWGIAHRVAPGVQRAEAAAPPGVGRGRGGPPDRPSMKERLGLTAAQCAAIDSVFHAQRGQIDAFWRGPGSQLRAILDSTRADVRAVLDSGQRVTLDSLEARRHRRGPDGGGGPGRFQRDQNFCGAQRSGGHEGKR